MIISSDGTLRVFANFKRQSYNKNVDVSIFRDGNLHFFVKNVIWILQIWKKSSTFAPWNILWRTELGRALPQRGIY